MSISTIPGVKFITPQDRIYEYVLDFVLATASFGGYFQIYHRLHVTSYEPSLIKGKLLYPTVSFQALASKYHLEFIPHELFVDVIFNDTRNSQIAYLVSPNWESITGVDADANSMFSGFANAMFVHFYEAHIHEIINKYSKKTDKWPEVLRFARTIRNSMSHGGKIEIRNPTERPVTHFGLTYTSANNGKLIRADLSFADIFFLMLDMDKSF